MSRRKPYVRPMTGWWRRNPAFKRYMLREATAVLLALYALVLLLGAITLANGEHAYGIWLAAVRHPLSVLAHLAVLGAVVFHAITWFEVSPKAMPPVRVGGERVPAKMIITGQYVATGITTLAILAIAWGG